MIRRGVEFVLQALIDAEATEVVGAPRHERTATRTNQRNGTRERLLSTKAENATGPRYRGPDQLFCERTTGFEPATLTLARRPGQLAEQGEDDEDRSDQD